MRDNQIHEMIEKLTAAVRKWKVPIVTEISRNRPDPFKILVSTVLSLRTKDQTTAGASERLFSLAETPERMLSLSREEIAGAIYPVGFYNTKAANILEICRDLVERFKGMVPDSLEQLLSLRGVGRKTANLVLTKGFNKPGICVDTHVHRISNRLGYVRTRNPEQTETALREKLPIQYWMIINDLLVTFGQNLCQPVSPFCSRCPVFSLCDRVGVLRSR